MRVLDPGHYYELRSLDDPRQDEQVHHVRYLQFVKRGGEKYPGNHDPLYGGTTSQEVLRALHDRACYLHNQVPCWQTRLSIHLLAVIIWLYEHRAAKRHGRRPPTIHDAVWGSTCSLCLHVRCEGRCLAQKSTGGIQV